MDNNTSKPITLPTAPSEPVKPPGIILAPWKNPLVQTAFMLKARRGGLYTVTIIYLILVISGGFIWTYYSSMQNQVQTQEAQARAWKYYFMFLVIGQTCFSSLLAGIHAAGSMARDVTQKTLDFQRMAGVDPWTILLGKLLGPPATAYLFAISVFPVALFCIINGIPGVGLLELVLLWVSLFTSAFFIASVFVQNSIHAAGGKNTSGGFAITFVILLVQFNGISMVSGMGMKETLLHPMKSLFPSLFTPIISWTATGNGMPWAGKYWFFNVGIPTLLFSPVMQLFWAWLCLSFMVRKFQNANYTMVSKKTAFVLLPLLALLISGPIFSTGGDGPLGAAGYTPATQLKVFCLTYTILSTLIFLISTPKREMLTTWFWKESPRNVAQFTSSERGHNLSVIAVAVLVGLAGAALLILLNNPSATIDQWLLPVAVMVTVLVTWGLMIQFCNMVGAKYNMAGIWFYFIVLVVVPVMVAVLLNQSMRGEGKEICGLLGSISPGYIALALGTEAAGNPTFHPYYTIFFALHILLSGVFLTFITKRLKKMAEVVESKKQAMGITPAS